MKYLLTLIVFANITLFGQDELRKRGFFIGGFASPDISHRYLLNNTGMAKTIANTRESYEIPKFGYTLGVNAYYQLNSRIALTIGIEYSSKGQKTKDLDLEFGDQINPRRGFIVQWPSEKPTKVNFIYKVNYIQIPIRIDYYLNKRKIAPFITTGISTNIFINEKVISTQIFEDNHKEKLYSSNNTGYNIINPQFQLGGGLDVAIKKSRLRIFPIYSISFSKVHSGSINEYLYSYGFGFNYLFGL